MQNLLYNLFLYLSDVIIYTYHVEAISYISNLLSDNDHLIVLGDFNLPNIFERIFNEINLMQVTFR